MQFFHSGFHKSSFRTCLKFFRRQISFHVGKTFPDQLSLVPSYKLLCKNFNIAVETFITPVCAAFQLVTHSKRIGSLQSQNSSLSKSISNIIFVIKKICHGLWAILLYFLPKRFLWCSLNMVNLKLFCYRHQHLDKSKNSVKSSQT